MSIQQSINSIVEQTLNDIALAELTPWMKILAFFGLIHLLYSLIATINITIKYTYKLSYYLYARYWRNT